MVPADPITFPELPPDIADPSLYSQVKVTPGDTEVKVSHFKVKSSVSIAVDPDGLVTLTWLASGPTGVK